MEENNPPKVLREVQKYLAGRNLKILAGLKDYFREIDQWSDEELLRMRMLVDMWGIDTIVRLLDLCKDPDLDPMIAYSQASKIFGNLDFESFMKLNVYKSDTESIRILTTVWFLFIRIEIEIRKRLKSPKRKIGLKLLTFLHRFGSSRAIDDLLNQTRKQIKQSRKKIPLYPEMTNVLQALNPKGAQYKNSLLKKKMIPKSQLDAEEYRHDVILKYCDWYRQFIRKLNPDELNPYKQGYSILKKKYPLNNPTWDDSAPLMLWGITQLLKANLPMFCGETEKIPLKIRDSFKTRFRRLPKKELESLHDEIQTEDGENGFYAIDFVKQRAKSPGELDSFLVDEVLRDLLDKGSFRDDKDRIMAENYGKSDHEIADIVFNITGESITKQAIRKRRIQHVEPIIGPLLEIRKVMMEDQNRDCRKNIEIEYDKRLEKNPEYPESNQVLTDIIK